MNEKRTLRAINKIKPKKDDKPYMRMFFGLDTTKRFFEKSKGFGIRELTKPKTALIPLIRTLKTGTMIRKASMLFKDCGSQYLHRSNPITV